jgi:hypothetical protein
MSPFWKRLHCYFSGHPVSITHLDTFNGWLYPTHETCFCGNRVKPMFPGWLMIQYRLQYEECPIEYEDLYEET